LVIIAAYFCYVARLLAVFGVVFVLGRECHERKDELNNIKYDLVFVFFFFFFAFACFCFVFVLLLVFFSRSLFECFARCLCLFIGKIMKLIKEKHHFFLKKSTRKKKNNHPNYDYYIYFFLKKGRRRKRITQTQKKIKIMNSG
jgi:hypothetical protein